MKRYHLCIALAMLAAATATGQKFTNADTAAAIVDNYIKMINIEGLPIDSMLYVETIITTRGVASDTVVLRRWWAKPQMHRVEVWCADTLQTALCGNGTRRWRQYYPELGEWGDIGDMHFYERLAPYDLRGPLFQWRGDGIKLTYNGVSTLQGEEFEMVKAESPERYTRVYGFSHNTGILTVAVEQNDIDGYVVDSASNDPGHIDWRLWHEYTPIGRTSMLPSLESFARNGVLTILESRYQFMPIDERIFNRD